MEKILPASPVRRPQEKKCNDKIEEIETYEDKIT